MSKNKIKIYILFILIVSAIICVHPQKQLFNKVNFMLVDDNIDDNSHNTIQNQELFQSFSQTNKKINLSDNVNVKKIYMLNISWNEWYANLANKILNDLTQDIRDKKIVFDGKYIYKLSFTVYYNKTLDKVQVVPLRSDSILNSFNPNNVAYENSAVSSAQYVKKIVERYAGNNILTFPKGTKRTYYNFEILINSTDQEQSTGMSAQELDLWEKVKVSD